MKNAEVEKLEKALKKEPERPDLMVRLARLFVRNGALAAARDYYRKALSRKKDPAWEAEYRKVSDPGKRQVTAFVHIPKTAGSSLNAMFSRCCVKPQIFTISPQWLSSFEELLALPAEQRDLIRYVHGHMPLGVHHAFELPTQYVTMLRNPVERIISTYYHIKRFPQHPMHEELFGAGDMSLERFLEYEHPNNKANNQTSILGQMPTALTVEAIRAMRTPMGPDTLANAKRHIEELGIAVGVQDRFDDSVGLLREVTGFDIKALKQKKMVGQGRPEASEVPADVIRKIEEREYLDMELYHFCRDRLG